MDFDFDPLFHAAIFLIVMALLVGFALGKWVF